MVKNPPAMQETQIQFLGQERPWRRDRHPFRPIPSPADLPDPGFELGSPALQAWALGRRTAVALGAGMLGSRCSEHGLEGRGSRWPHPFVLSGCLHLVAGVKNPPAMLETQVQSLGQEDPLE